MGAGASLVQSVGVSWYWKFGKGKQGNARKDDCLSQEQRDKKLYPNKRQPCETRWVKMARRRRVPTPRSLIKQRIVIRQEPRHFHILTRRLETFPNIQLTLAKKRH